MKITVKQWIAFATQFSCIWLVLKNKQTKKNHILRGFIQVVVWRSERLSIEVSRLLALMWRMRTRHQTINRTLLCNCQHSFFSLKKWALLKTDLFLPFILQQDYRISCLLKIRLHYPADNEELAIWENYCYSFCPHKCPFVSTVEI